MEKYLTIKEVAKITGLSPSNIRYYESEGLIKRIKRNDVGIRQFREEEIQWIQFLGKLKNMEMPINQMKEYALLREQRDSTIGARMELLEKHRQWVLQKIKDQNENINLLDNKIEIYKQMEKAKNGK